MYCLRERTDFTHLFGMWKLLKPSTLSLSKLSAWSTTDKSKFNQFCSSWQDFYKVIRYSNYKCPNFTAFCFFQKAKIIVQRHYTLQPYKITCCFGTVLGQRLSCPSIVMGSPLGVSDHYLVLKTKVKGRVLDCRGPQLSWLLQDISVPYHWRLIWSPLCLPPLQAYSRFYGEVNQL